MKRDRKWMESERARAAYRRRSELLWAMLAYNVKQWVLLGWRGASANEPAAA